VKTENVLIENARLFDGEDLHSGNDHWVVCREGRIVAMGTGPSDHVVSADERIERYDARGMLLMPGLVDLHVHLTFGESRAQEEQDFYTSVERRTLRSAWYARRMLIGGVTSAAHAGGSYNIGVGIRDAVREGLTEGPRLQAAGRLISNVSGLGAIYPTWVGNPVSSIGVVVSSCEDIVTEVRTQIRNGVDFVKLADSTDGTYPAFTEEEVRSATSIAHSMNKRVLIHARGSEEVKIAVSAGVDWIMHANFMDDEAISMLVDSETVIVPTLTPQLNLADFGHLIGASAKRVERARSILDGSREPLNKAREAGVRFGTGTDTGFAHTPYGMWHGREMRALVDVAGFSDIEALRIATAGSGAIFDRAGKTGRIEVGCNADILIIRDVDEVDVDDFATPAKIVDRFIGGRRIILDDHLLSSHYPYDRGKVGANETLTPELVASSGASS
jgi:imidazolonepropionase-like amidohydrolase